MFQQLCVRQQFVLDFVLKRIKFRLEFRVEIYLPRHSNSMPLTAYVVNSILVEGEGERQGDAAPHFAT